MRQEQLLSVAQVAEYLNVDKFTIYRLVTDGQIPAFKVGNQWRFKKKIIEAKRQFKQFDLSSKIFAAEEMTKIVKQLWFATLHVMSPSWHRGRQSFQKH